ncbi:MULTISPECIES: hypothetical protein [unclassified Pseudovibrio]|uniref:hypothetical protein n=1 Tax=unclassified Pseudovibrio TaxID=2627060 RepID=UPI000186BCFD|nr:hypothetical protein [Pseudovibrio sp. JE062]EEA93816.1 hypothetical protein PJE062_3306 [Pseudovibrio sp. JE062]
MADTFMEEGFGMMLRGLKALAVVASLGFAGLAAPNAAYAWGELSCSELNATIIDIDDISDEVFFEGGVRAGSNVDGALGHLIDVGRLLAELEDDGKLDRAVDRLEDAWIDEDWNGYSFALDDIADRLDYFYDRDC